MPSSSAPPDEFLGVSRADRAAAAALGVACHGAFGVAIVAMIVSLHQGLRGTALVASNLAFAASWLLLVKAMSDAGLGLVGPLHKERRLLAGDPDGYGRYRAIVPYWLPRLAPQRLEP